MISIPFREAHNALKVIDSVKRNAVEAEVKVLEEEKRICEKGPSRSIAARFANNDRTADTLFAPLHLGPLKDFLSRSRLK